ncbi:hypothetical protein, partial [Spongiactinospora gelatinilytica]|uniref:hypothetical protein n=1 Tax=Spongiactinospora gelatinilytica TaxID=2666298 RepID=UPI001F1A5D93
TGPPGIYPDRTSTGKRRRAYEHKMSRYVTASPPFYWAHEKGSLWNTGSTNGSKTIAAAVCAIRSATVGTPSTRIPPAPFGISTILTGGGKYAPDDI